MTCRFKIHITNVDSRTQKSQKSTQIPIKSWFWPIYIMLELKNTEELCLIALKIVPNKVWRKTGLCFQKLTWGIWQIFTRALESLQIGTLMAYFCLKLKMYELKIHRGVMSHDNEEWCKNWRGIDLSVHNWHKEFDDFWPKHSKISKMCTLMGCFWPKYIMFELRKVQRSYVWWYWILMQNLKEKWLCAFKNDMRNLANFHQSICWKV